MIIAILLLVLAYVFVGCLVQELEEDYNNSKNLPRWTPRQYGAKLLYYPLRLVYYVGRYWAWGALKSTWVALKTNKWGE